MVPYGLGNAVPLPASFTPDLPGVTYDPARQVSTVDGTPAVESPAFLSAHAVTWGDTGKNEVPLASATYNA